MARIGRPTAEVVLGEEERETLERWARRPTSAQVLAQRCRIVLACAEGPSRASPCIVSASMTQGTSSRLRPSSSSRALRR